MGSGGVLAVKHIVAVKSSTAGNSWLVCRRELAILSVVRKGGREKCVVRRALAC
jgi:hypothetical protein